MHRCVPATGGKKRSVSVEVFRKEVVRQKHDDDDDEGSPGDNCGDGDGGGGGGTPAVDGTKVFAGTFTCFVLPRHVLSRV